MYSSQSLFLVLVAGLLFWPLAALWVLVGPVAVLAAVAGVELYARGASRGAPVAARHEDRAR